MKLGVLTVPLSQKSLKDALQFLAGLGVQAVELGAGGHPGTAHASPVELLRDKAKMTEFHKIVQESGLIISALSCHGNPVHPQREMAAADHRDFANAVRLAAELGVDRIITFSGCPGDSPASIWPNWVTCAWPEDYLKVLKYQWEDVLIPYWSETAAFARSQGVGRISLEMHPGFCVYNPESLLKLRAAVGETIGANFDPSHLFWQGIDPVAAIRNLGKAIYHFHAKDCRIDAANVAANGVLDTKDYNDVLNRSWVFRTIGYGHGPEIWKDMISALRLVGYDDVISIEHEDGLMSINEGLTKAITFLKDVLLFEDRSSLWWI
jgi:sugar phosphate isomerase/epimerase